MPLDWSTFDIVEFDKFVYPLLKGMMHHRKERMTSADDMRKYDKMLELLYSECSNKLQLNKQETDEAIRVLFRLADVDF